MADKSTRHWRIGERLGGGAWSEAWAVESEGARAVAKLPRADAPEAAADALRSEHAVLRRVAHPHLVRPLGLVERACLDGEGPPERGPVLLLERLEGPSLADAGLAGADGLRAWAQVAAAVDALHRSGFVHRDLKPENVLLRGEPGGGVEAVLVDLGTAVEAATDRSTPGAGTLDWVAPEVVAGAPPAIAADVHGLGALLAFLLTGRAPWAELPVEEALEARRHAPPTLPGDVPAGLRRAVEALLQPAPEARPATALAALDLVARESGDASLASGPETLVARPGLAPLVGRDAELERLLDLVDAACDGAEGCAVVITGAEGSGRTRLLDELAWRARGRGARVLHEVGPASEPRDVVLLDEPGGGLLDEPGSGLPSVPTRGLVVAAMPAGTEHGPPGPRRECLELAPLEASDCLALAAAVLGLGPDTAGDGESLRAASGGLPGVLEQLVATLAEDGAIALRDGRLEWDPRSASASDLLGLVARRFEGLGEEASLVLDLAAVLDAPVSAALLARFARREDEPDRVADALAELAAFGFVHRSSSAEGAAAFAVPRAVADARREAIAPARRRMLELGAAALLESVEGAEGRRAEHLDRAGASERAAELHVAAGRHALRHGRGLAAVRHLERAIAASSGVASDGGVHLDLARSLVATGRPREAVEAASSALERLATDSERAEALALVAEAASHSGEGSDEQAEAACRKARRLFRRAGSVAGRAECTNRLGVLAARRGDERRAAAAYRAALDAARRAGDRALEGRVLNNLGALERERGDLAAAARHLGEAHDLRRRLGDVRGAAKATNNLGIVQGLAGRFEEAAAAFADARSAFASCGDLAEEGRALNNRGMALWHGQRLAEAEASLAEAAELLREGGDAALVAGVERNRGLLALDRGRLDEAVERLREAIEIAPSTAGAHADLGDVLRARGDLEAAGRHHEEAARLAEAAGAGLAAVTGRLSAALDRALAGEELDQPLPDAEALLPPAVDPSHRDDEALRCRLELGRLAECRGEDELARRLGREALHVEGLDAHEHLEATLLDAGARPDAAGCDAIADALTRLPQGTHPELSFRARLRLARGLAAAGRTSGAAAQAESALALLDRLSAMLPPEERERFAEAEDRSMARAELEAIAATAGELAGAAGVAPPESAPVVLELVRLINENLDVAELLPRIVDAAIELAAADRGCLILFDEEPALPRVARDAGRRDLPRETFRHSRTIVDRVRRDGRPVVVESFAGEGMPRSESIHELALGSAACVPLAPPAGVAGGLLGALYVDSVARRERFGERAIDVLMAMAAHAGTAIVNAQLLARAQAERESLSREVERLRGGEEGEARGSFGEALGRSPAMREIFGLLERVAPSEASVLIEGESGTGKEVLARALHGASRRSTGPFVAVDCGSLPESLIESELFGHRRGAFTGADRDRAGLFEQAQGGTIFLDEIAGTSPPLQAKLLRVLQEREVRRIGENASRPVDARVVAASNRNLASEVAAGRFREDLFYRLNVVPVRLPPLRERPEDVTLLARHFLERAVAREGRSIEDFDEAALRLLAAAPWQGNVRELQNVVDRLVVLAEGPLIRVDDLPVGIAGRGPQAAERPAAQTAAFESAAGSTSPGPGSGPTTGSASGRGPRIDLWHHVVEEGASFWTEVRDAFQSHDITREDVRALFARALTETGGSYKEAVRRLGVAEDDYKRVMDFLRQNRCKVDFRPFRAAAKS